MTNREAEERLKGTFANDKNEILFSQFSINYNNEPDQFKKGTTLYRKMVEIPLDSVMSEEEISKMSGRDKGRLKFKLRTVVDEFTGDIIQDDFWDSNPHLLNYKLL